MARDAASIRVEPAELPHWARVAFAARCARRVLPLFHRAWPGVPTKHAGSVRGAIELAEGSAAEGKALEGLHAAVINAMMAAGAALRDVYGMPAEEPAPADEHNATIASSVAKVAERAAEAADTPPGGSARIVLDGFGFAFSAFTESGERSLWQQTRRDFANLRRIASRGKWNDRTPVPPSVFDLLAEDDDRTKPWWKLW